MPRVNRREILSPREVQAFHVVSRCVRQQRLCGRDASTGRDYSHRKQWLCNRQEHLAKIFAIDLQSFAVMSNHLHLVLRTRPDLAEKWTDDEVALRWWMLCPKRKEANGQAATPTDDELDRIRNDRAGLAEKRSRLSSLSWFMKFLIEPIAKLANREDGLQGHFWESRFKAQPLLDETAVLAAMVYTDLNPIRAGLAETPEDSDYTSIQCRIADRQAARRATDSGHCDVSAEHGIRAGWLSPIELEPANKRDRQVMTGRRASNRGCLQMTLDKYLQLVDLSGREIRSDKRGSIPPQLDDILSRLELDSEVWLDLMMNFQRRFRVEVGRSEAVQAARHRRLQLRRGLSPA